MKKFILLFVYCIAALNADPKVEGLKQRVSNALPYIEGWCSKEKALNFIDLILEVKPDVYVEIGAYGGSSVFPVASTLKFLNHGVIIAIDAWDNGECIKYYDPEEDRINLEWWSSLNLNYIYQSYIATIRKYNLEKYCITINANSETAAYQIDQPIDILYIDGNSCEEVSTLDVKLYLPKVRSGGYIWINDALAAGRQEALDLLLEDCTFVKFIDNGNCILFKKR